MALDSTALLVPDSGNFFTAPYVSATPTALPADLLKVSSPFENIGHTSLEELFSVTSEGGEATSLGTLQNKSLRTTYSPRSETFNIALQQFDTPALKLYYGANSEVGTNGELMVPTQPVPTIVTFLAVFIDGNNYFGFYAPKAEVLRADDLNFADHQNFASLPLGVKPVPHGENKWAYAVTPLGSVPSGA